MILNGIVAEIRRVVEQPNRTPTQSHQSILAGPSGARHSWSIEPKKQAARLVGTELYKAFLKYLLLDEELVENGYPQFHPSGERGQ